MDTVVTSKEPPRMKTHSLSRLFLALVALAALAAAPATPAAPAGDPKKLDEQYVPGPDSKAQEGVPKGTVTKYSWKESKNFPGTERDYWVYVPKQYDEKTPACVYVNQDGI